MAFAVDLALLGLLLACPAVCGGGAVISWLLSRSSHGKHESAGLFDSSCPLCTVPKRMLAARGEQQDK